MRAWLPLLLVCVGSSANAKEQQKGADPTLATLKQSFAEVLKAYPAITALHVGISVRDTRTGNVIYEQNADESFSVASNQKLVTMAATLDKLGTGFTFETTIFVQEKPSSKTIPGSIFVRSHADPAMNWEDLDALARQIAASGVDQIRGGICLDTSYFDDENLPHHYSEQPHERAYFRAPISATSIYSNMFRLSVAPSPSGVGLATIHAFPSSEYISIQNQVVTVGTGRTKLSISHQKNSNRLVLSLSGTIRAGTSPRMYRYRMDEPEMFYGAVLKYLLKQRGVSVKGDVSKCHVPTGAIPIATLRAPRLLQTLTSVGKFSNNFRAEMLLKILGAEDQGSPGTWSAGLAVVSTFMANIGFPAGTYRYGNGSGLFDSSSYTPNQFTKLLTYTLSQNWAPEFLASLSIAGRDGTLRNRMKETAAEGVIRAKTGTLNGAIALSGFAYFSPKHNYAFSFLVDGLNGSSKQRSQTRQLQSDLAIALAEAAAKGIP